MEWFGDHSYSKVDRGSLTSYEEGLQQYLSSKKGKHRRYVVVTIYSTLPNIGITVKLVAILVC